MPRCGCWEKCIVQALCVELFVRWALYAGGCPLKSHCRQQPRGSTGGSGHCLSCLQGQQLLRGWYQIFTWELVWGACGTPCP